MEYIQTSVCNILITINHIVFIIFDGNEYPWHVWSHLFCLELNYLCWHPTNVWTYGKCRKSRRIWFIVKISHLKSTFSQYKYCLVWNPDRLGLFISMRLDALSGQFVLLDGRLSNTFHFGFEAGNKVRGSDYYLMKGVRAQQNCRLTKVWNECFESCPKSTSCSYLWCSKEQKVQKKN